jgi:hypothetical protein
VNARVVMVRRKRLGECIALLINEGYELVGVLRKEKKIEVKERMK